MNTVKMFFVSFWKRSTSQFALLMGLIWGPLGLLLLVATIISDNPEDKINYFVCAIMIFFSFACIAYAWPRKNQAPNSTEPE